MFEWRDGQKILNNFVPTGNCLQGLICFANLPLSTYTQTPLLRLLAVCFLSHLK